MIEAVVFDLDGVLIDSEQLWDAARRELVEERGGRWRESATTDMLGMSSREWPRYVRDEFGVDMEPEAISALARQLFAPEGLSAAAIGPNEERFSAAVALLNPALAA